MLRLAVMVGAAVAPAGATSLPVDLCAGKSCGDVCATSQGMLQVIRHCQPNGACEAPIPQCDDTEPPVPPIADGAPPCVRCPTCPGCPLACEGENEEHRSCSGCEGTCSNPNPICVLGCQPPKCQCKSGFVRNVRSGECIDARECPVDRCAGKSCGDVCATSQGMLQVLLHCQPNGACEAPIPQCDTEPPVPPIADGTPICVRCPTCPGCPQACEGENEEYHSCSGCEGTCGDLTPICTQDCQDPKCQCKSGFVRRNGACIDALACPVVGEGQACGFVFAPEPWAGDCEDGLECLCVGACANQMIADAPSTCVRPAAAGMRWSKCTRSNARLSAAPTGEQPALASQCNRRGCTGVKTAEACRNLRFGSNCDGQNCAGANWNSRNKVCVLCKSTGSGQQQTANNQVALAAVQTQQAAGPSTGILAGVVGGVVGAMAAAVAACVVVVRRRAAGEQQASLASGDYHKDAADV